MNSLLLLACSGTKGAGAAPAIDLYRGVMYGSLRAHVKPLTRPRIVILSALHGFVEPETVIAPYDVRMSAARSDRMLAELPQLLAGVRWPRNIDHVFLAGGQQYRKVMRAAATAIAPHAAVDECSGGIGVQRSQLGRYLQNLPTQRGEVLGHHPNGTPLYASIGHFNVGDEVGIRYRAIASPIQQHAIIRQLFDGPRGETASIELLGPRPDRHRWINLRDLEIVAVGNA